MHVFFSFGPIQSLGGMGVNFLFSVGDSCSRPRLFLTFTGSLFQDVLGISVQTKVTNILVGKYPEEGGKEPFVIEVINSQSED